MAFNHGETRGDAKRMNESQRTSMPEQLEPDTHHAASTLIETHKRLPSRTTRRTNERKTNKQTNKHSHKG